MRRQLSSMVVSVAVLLSCASAAVADTIYVNGTTGNDAWDGRCEVWDGGTCGPKRTIQAGIDVSVGGDEVSIADGRYTGAGNFNLTFGGKLITVRSAGGPRECIIDCEGNGRGFVFESGETSAAILDGLTITGGAAQLGGGVIFSQSSPQIRNCVIQNNRATGTNGGGGGIFMFDADPVFINCDIVDNYSEENGGGVSMTSGGASFQACTIERNRSHRSGGGVYSYGAAPFFVNCIVRDNISQRTGGGFDLMHSSGTLTNCTVVGNVAGHRDGGGGVLFDRGSLEPNRMTNCIVWGNFAQVGPEIAVTSAELVVSFCAVKGGQSQVLSHGSLTWGEGNIDSDPRFAFWEDFHLLTNSPTIDAGTNSPFGGLPGFDADGIARPLDGDGDGNAVADIGAYEYDPSGSAVALTRASYAVTVPVGSSTAVAETLFIRKAGGAALGWEIDAPCPFVEASPAFGQADGAIEQVELAVDPSGLEPGDYECVLTISDAQGGHPARTVTIDLRVRSPLRVPQGYPTIQAAIDAAEQHDLILIDDGVYSGVGNRNLDFNGKELVVRSLNGPENCVIDCDRQRAFNFHSGEGPDAVVEGLTITNGGEGDGAGIVVVGSSTAPIIRDCIITGNTAGQWGGGILCRSGSFPNIVRCTIVNNQADDYGGGIMCQSRAHPTIRNCTITGNRSHYGGGGIAIVNSGATIVNCTVTNNVVDLFGGGIYAFESLHRPTVVNTIVWDNSASQGAEIALRQIDDLCTLSVSYSDVEGGEQGVFFVGGDCRLDWGPGNIDADPLFVDAASGDYRLGIGSPVIDSGDNDVAPPDDAGIDRTPRFVDDPATPDTGNGAAPVIDMGALEFQTVLVPADIKPGSCPNPLNRTSRGKVPVAVVGTSEFDVSMIDVESLVLTRADGVGGMVRPLNGPPGPRVRVEDVATPFEGEPCDCHELRGDGIDDLSMKFDTQTLVAELELGGLPGGSAVELVVSGRLLDGTNFSGVDCIRLVPPHGGGLEAERNDGEAPDDDAQSKPSLSFGVPKENDGADDDSAGGAVGPAPVGCGGVMPSLLFVTMAGMWFVRRRARPM